MDCRSDAEKKESMIGVLDSPILKFRPAISLHPMPEVMLTSLVPRPTSLIPEKITSFVPCDLALQAHDGLIFSELFHSRDHRRPYRLTGHYHPRAV